MDADTDDRLAAVMAQLESLGTEQNRTVFPRHGVRGPQFGVSYANLAKLQKQLGTDHALATALWATGNHDARILATKIADPAALTVKQADAMVRACHNYVEVEALAGLVGRAPLAAGRAAAWRDRKAEWVASTGWAVTAHLALQPDALDDAERRRLIAQVTAEIHQRPNRVRHEMNGTLIAIGVSGDEAVRQEALAAAAAIGKVDVDHGRTSCKTPDAASYIAKTVERQSAGRS